jgi:hypothetical protein
VASIDQFVRAVIAAAALGVPALTLMSCAGPTPTQSVLPGLESEDLEPGAGYEPLPVLRASELLPPDLLSGPHHRVREAVETDGFLHRYVIDSDFGELEAAGDDLLRLRVREITALAELDRMQKREEFAKAMAAGLKSPFVAAWNLLRDPVDSILGIPQSAWDTLKRTAEISKRERGELEDSGFREFIGFEVEKRELAYQLGVDPYSSNPVLQKELNRFAWAAYLGGLPFAFVPFQGEPPVEIVPTGSGADGRLREILRHYAPEDLRRLNRIELAVMGVPEQTADAFLSHPWYSPRHGTILVESLVALDLTQERARFIDTALRAGSEADARFYQRAAQLLRVFHENDQPLARLLGGDRVVMGLSHDGDLVVPLILDHALWSRPAERFAEGILEAQRETGAASLRLLVSGTLSERARSELEVRGIIPVERAFEQLGKEIAESVP